MKKLQSGPFRSHSNVHEYDKYVSDFLLSMSMCECHADHTQQSFISIWPKLLGTSVQNIIITRNLYKYRKKKQPRRNHFWFIDRYVDALFLKLDFSRSQALIIMSSRKPHMYIVQTVFHRFGLKCVYVRWNKIKSQMCTVWAGEWEWKSGIESNNKKIDELWLQKHLMKNKLVDETKHTKIIYSLHFELNLNFEKIRMKFSPQID